MDDESTKISADVEFFWLYEGTFMIIKSLVVADRLFLTWVEQEKRLKKLPEGFLSIFIAVM